MIKKSYDLYGIDCNGLDNAKALIQNLLGVTLLAHESGFRCGEYYRLHDVGQEHFILQKNYDDIDEEWIEEEFLRSPLIFYVNETDRSSVLQAVLLKDKRITLLRHEEL
ncbi:hypothetical protein ACJJIX_00050 [Microbulbifer sp. VAAC004]|uniref:hypothetical protein n=1 Tax=unclassified Microbulbifer TaxID=2619833 RepID=UPI004039391A